MNSSYGWIAGLLALFLVAGCQSPKHETTKHETPSDAAETDTTATSDEAATGDAPTPAEKPEPRPVVLSGATDGPVRATLAIASTDVELGDWIEAEVTITNASSDPTRIKQLAHDTQSVSFAIVWNESTSFEFEKLVHFGGSPREWESPLLEPGASATESFRIPTLVAGPMQIGVRYRGAGEDLVRSDAITVNVGAPEGARLGARLETNYGELVVGFWPDIAPNTSLHFVELTKKGDYDDVYFHRLYRGFVLQGGDPFGNGTGDFGYKLRAEFSEEKHLPAVLSMARGEDLDSAGSQFFICLGEASHLDGGYTAFGEVIEGFETTVRKIESEAQTRDGSDQLYDDVFIKKATVEVVASATSSDSKG